MEISRRRVLTGGAVGAFGLASGVALGRATAPNVEPSDPDGDPDGDEASVPFRAARQAGIETPSQRHAALVSFEVVERDRAAMRDLLAEWTDVGEALCAGRAVANDTGEATGLAPARLTATFGFGASFFDDECAPRAARPARLVDLPTFPGDALEDAWNGGDLVVQVCADDPTVVSHAVRQLRRTGNGRVASRWMQNGFLPQAPGQTSRNLFGQVDGTANPAPGSSEFDELVWARAGDGPDWMTGGTFMAVRRIRMNLTMWDRMGLDVQEAAVGRRRDSGAPLTGGDEFAALDLDAERDGQPVIATDAHVRLAKGTGPGMVRRGYSFDDGPRATVGATVEIPAEMDHAQHDQMDHMPMGAAMDDHDSGLLFIAFVRDPARQFVPMQQALSDGDALGHFLAYTSSSLWAVPPGARTGAIAAEIYR